MSRILKVISCFSLLILALSFFSCEGTGTGADDTTDYSQTLAGEVVNELGEYLAAQSLGLSVARAVTLDSEYINELKNMVLQDLKDEGLIESTSLGEILPAAISSVSAYLESTQTSDAEALEIICLTTESLVTSAGMTDRAENIAEGTDLKSVISTVASKSVQMITDTVEDAEILAASVGTIVKSTVISASSTQVVNNNAAAIEEIVIDIVNIVIEECSASESQSDPNMIDTVIVGIAEAVAETAADTSLESLDSGLIEKAFETSMDKFVELELEDKINDVIQEVDDYVADNETALDTLGDVIQDTMGDGLLEKVKGKYTFGDIDPANPDYDKFSNVDWFEFTADGFTVSYMDGEYLFTADVEYTEITEGTITFILYWTYHPWQYLKYQNIRFSSYDGNRILMEAEIGSDTLETAQSKIETFGIEYRYEGTRVPVSTE